MGKKIDVVISGGSVEGICTSTGFLKAVVDDLGHKIIAGAGNSAGGIVLGAYASGLTVSEIERSVIETDFTKLVSMPKWYQAIEIWRVFRRGWLSDGKAFDEFLAKITNNKLMSDANFDLYIVGSDFTSRSLAVFSKKTESDMPLWIAMRITSCMPGAFKPVTYRGHVFYDGGVRRHYPIDILPISDRPLYGYLLGHDEHRSKVEVDTRPGLLNTLGDYIDNAVDANVHDAVHRSRDIKMRKDVTIAYDDVKVGSFDFGISADEKIRLIQTARQTTLDKLKMA